MTSPDYVVAQFHKYGINIRKVDSNTVSVSFDELSSLYHLDELIEIFINTPAFQAVKPAILSFLGSD